MSGSRLSAQFRSYRAFVLQYQGLLTKPLAYGEVDSVLLSCQSQFMSIFAGDILTSLKHVLICLQNHSIDLKLLTFRIRAPAQSPCVLLHGIKTRKV